MSSHPERHCLAPIIESFERRLLCSASGISVENTALMEVPGSGAQMVFTLQRSGDLSATINVNYHTLDGSATAQVDYQPVQGMAQFSTGQSMVQIKVPVFGNWAHQWDRTFCLQLSAPDAFEEPQVFTTGSYAGDLALGDLNGDGIPDLAAASFDQGTAMILPGSADGGFQAAIHTDALGTSPNAPAIGDFDGDGMQDLAVGLYDEKAIIILRGAGDGTFSSSTRLATHDSPTSLRTADFNGDGNLDLAVICAGDNAVDLFLGDGAGGFGAALSGAVGAVSLSSVVGDFNGDGRADLAVTGMLGGVDVLIGKGDGTFEPKINYPGGDISPWAITTADFNGDGHLDLVAAGPSGKAWVLLGKGDGTFEPLEPMLVGWRVGGIAAGDFNHDGLPDLALTTYEDHGQVILAFGQGDGTFASFQSMDVGSYPRMVIASDVNGDGLSDLVVADYGGNTVHLFLAKAGGGATVPTQPITGTILDNDNAADAIAAYVPADLRLRYKPVQPQRTYLSLNVRKTGKRLELGATLATRTRLAPPDSTASRNVKISGTVEWRLDGKSIGSAQAGKTLVFAHRLSKGIHTLKAIYRGGNGLSAASSVVKIRA
jgi:hypothetical protein